MRDNEARIRLAGSLDPGELRLVLGVLIAHHPEVFDEIMASVPESWHRDAPGTIETVVASSIEHQSNYRNELRHPGM